jgi:hypothetical protein
MNGSATTGCAAVFSQIIICSGSPKASVASLKVGDAYDKKPEPLSIRAFHWLREA